MQDVVCYPAHRTVCAGMPRLDISHLARRTGPVAIRTGYTERMFFKMLEASASDRSSGAPDRLKFPTTICLSNGSADMAAVRCTWTRFGSPNRSEGSPATASVGWSGGAPNWHCRGGGSGAPLVLQFLPHSSYDYLRWLGL
jgi:hypothetical protein